MPNTFFRFQRFVVHQERCAMKVGTDSVLLGAWANGGRHILDVGSGTGVISLMMAQRFPQAKVEAVDIDEEACRQAVENAEASPFVHQVSIACCSIQELARTPHLRGSFDAVVSNPPFFDNALKTPDASRNMARHTDSLPFDQLFLSVRYLMAPTGEFSAIIPFDYKAKFLSEAALNGFVVSREYAVKTTPKKRAKRYLLAFRIPPAEEFDQQEVVLETMPGIRSEWYEMITRDFYL